MRVSSDGGRDISELGKPEWAGIGGSRLGRLLLALFIVAATLAVYSPVLQRDTGFLWDDDTELWGHRGHLVQEPGGLLTAWFPIQKPEAGWHDVRSWKPLPQLGFWPLTPTVFWLQWRLWNADERWQQGGSRVEKIAAVEQIAYRFHLPNVVLHALAAVLVWLLLARLGVAGAWWVGLVFALHPVNVPSVAWVSELKNTLSLPLLLGSLLLFLRCDERPRRGVLSLSLLLFFLSLCAKTSGVAFPLVLLGCAWWQRGTLTRVDALRVAPFFAVAFVMGLTTLWFVGSSGGLSGLVVSPESFLHRLAGAGWIPWFYAWKTIAPVDLMMIYPRFEIPWRSPLAYLPGLALVSVLAWAWWRRERWGRAVLLALGSFVVLLFPVLGFFDMTFMLHSMVSDHLYYLSIIPLLALLIPAARSLCLSRPRGRPLWTVLALAIALVLGGATWQRAGRFKSHVALWSHNVALNPDAWMAQYDLGSSLLVLADRREPGFERESEYRRALAHLRRAVALQPAYEVAHYRLGTVLARLGRDREAIAAWRAAIEVAELETGGEPARTGRHHREIAQAAARLGQLDLARAEYERTLALVPSAWRLQLELAEVLERQGDERAAMAQYRRILASRPRQFDAQVSLALLLASSRDDSIRDGDRALRHALRARRATSQLAPGQRLRVLHALAAARAERAWAGSAGEGDGFQAAVDLSRQALQLARAAGRAEDVALAVARLRLYQSGRPLRRAEGGALDANGPARW